MFSPNRSIASWAWCKNFRYCRKCWDNLKTIACIMKAGQRSRHPSLKNVSSDVGFLRICFKRRLLMTMMTKNGIISEYTVDDYLRQDENAPTSILVIITTYGTWKEDLWRFAQQITITMSKWWNHLMKRDRSSQK